MAKLTCYGGAGVVTGANFLLEIGSKKVLVDCGMVQGVSGSAELNASDFEYDPSSIDILFITHAHIDHIGRIPLLVKKGFKGEIWSTPETKSISDLMLADSARIAERNIETRGGEPIYRMSDVEASMQKWNTFSYHEPKDFGGFSAELYDAGHILGSSMIKFSIDGKSESMLFTGDLGNYPSLLLKDTEKVEGVKYMVMESVYGDKKHEDRSEREEKFKRAVLNIIEKKGTLLIPAFSLERTQVVLHLLDDLFEKKEVPVIPVFLDSPLSIHVTEIYERITKHYNNHIQDEVEAGDDVFSFPKLKETAEVRDSREIRNVPGPKIIIAGSGMSTAGRIVGHEEEFLPDPNAAVLFLGYQAVGTLGRQIADGLKSVRIGDRDIKVKAHVETITGFSAHADSDQLVDFVSHSKDTLEQVFVGMGEPHASIFLSQRLRDELGVEALVPERGKTYNLDL